MKKKKRVAPFFFLTTKKKKERNNWKRFHHKVNAFPLSPFFSCEKKRVEKKRKHIKPRKKEILSNSLFPVVLYGQKNWSKKEHSFTFFSPLLAKRKKKDKWILFCPFVRRLNFEKKTNLFSSFFFPSLSLLSKRKRKKKKEEKETCQPISSDQRLFSRQRSRSLSELTRQITPPTTNGHAPPLAQSWKRYQAVNP